METFQSSQLLYIKAISLLLETWGLQALGSVECGACTAFYLFLVAVYMLAIGLCVLLGAWSVVGSPKPSSLGLNYPFTHLLSYCHLIQICLFWLPLAEEGWETQEALPLPLSALPIHAKDL